MRWRRSAAAGKRRIRNRRGRIERKERGSAEGRCRVVQKKWPGMRRRMVRLADGVEYPFAELPFSRHTVGVLGLLMAPVPDLAGLLELVETSLAADLGADAAAAVVESGAIPFPNLRDGDGEDSDSQRMWEEIIVAMVPMMAGMRKRAHAG